MKEQLPSMEKPREDASKINEMVDLGFLTKSQASMESLDEYLAKEGDIEILKKDIVLALKHGHVSDNIVMSVKNEEEVRHVRIHMSESKELEFENLGAYNLRMKETEPLEEHAELKSNCEKEGFSFAEVEISGVPLTDVVMGNISEGFLKNYAIAIKGYDESIELVCKKNKEYAIDFLRTLGNNSKNDLNKLISEEKQRLLTAEGLSFMDPRIVPLNIIQKALANLSHGEGKRLEENYDSADLDYRAFHHMLLVFGPKYFPEQQELYLRELEKVKIRTISYGDDKFNVSKIKQGIPKGKLMKGLKLAEIGGNYTERYKDYGVEVTSPERYFETGELGGIKGDEQITSENFEKLYPEKYDIVISRQVMAHGSGVAKGFEDDYAGSEDLLKACAEITKENGLGVHQGGCVPAQKGYLEELGLELVFTFSTTPEPTYLFLKKNPAGY